MERSGKGGKRRWPASSTENPHCKGYPPRPFPHCFPHCLKLLLPIKPLFQTPFLRHTAERQGFPTPNSQTHTVLGSVCQPHVASRTKPTSAFLIYPCVHFCATDSWAKAIIWDTVERGSYSYIMLTTVIENLRLLQR